MPPPRSGIADVRAFAIVALVLQLLGSCNSREIPVKEGPSIEAVLAAHKPRLLSIEGVVGVGQGLCQGQPCLKVLVRENSAELERRVGTTIDGHPVEIVATGEFRRKKDGR